VLFFTLSSSMALKKRVNPAIFVLDFAPFSFLHRCVQKSLNPLQYLRFPALPVPFFLPSHFVLEFTPLQEHTMAETGKI